MGKKVARKTVRPYPGVKGSGESEHEVETGTFRTGELNNKSYTNDVLRCFTKPLPESHLPPEVLNELMLFDYHIEGFLLTPLTPAHMKFTLDSGILGIDCKLVGVKPKPGKSHRKAVGRISVVNENGYCLYDRFVLPQWPVVDYNTDSSGIQEKHFDKAIPHKVMVRDVKKLINGHILVGLGLTQIMHMLRIGHPKKLRREINRYISLRMGPISPPKTIQSFVKSVFDIDMERNICSVKAAQGAITLYKAFQSQWEQSIRDTYKNVIPKKFSSGRFQELENIAVTMPLSSVPQKFQYDQYGQLSRCTCVHTAHTVDTGIVSLACETFGEDERACFVGRVSIVNEHGFCLYDKFISGRDVLNLVSGELLCGIPKDEFVKWAIPISTVKCEIQNLLQNHVVVGHRLEESLASIGVVIPQLCMRDTDRYLRSLFGFRDTVTLSALLREEFNIELYFEHGQSNSILAAQSAMELYKRYKKRLERFIRRENGGVNLLSSTLSNFKNSKHTSTMETPQQTGVNISPSLGADRSSQLIGKDIIPYSILCQNLSTIRSGILQVRLGQLALASKKINQYGKNDIVGVAFKLVSIGRKIRMTRVSVVDLNGYCLYDKLVKPKKISRAIYNTSPIGIWEKHAEIGFPPAIVLNEIQTILQGRIVICHGGKEILRSVLQYSHPTDYIRDTSMFVPKKLRMTENPNFHALVKKALNVDLTGEESNSIANAQAAIELYRKYEHEWEEFAKASTKANIKPKSVPIKIEKSLTPANDHSQNLPHALKVLRSFKYDYLGKLIRAQEAPAQFRMQTRTVALDYEVVEVESGPYRATRLGRVSIVNEHGFCLYDTFVKPYPPVIKPEYGDGICEECLENAPRLEDVAVELKPWLDGCTVVGHSIKNASKVLPMRFHWMSIRDTAECYQRKRKMSHEPALKNLVNEYFGMKFRQGEPNNPIKNAQVAMALYLLGKEECDKLFEY